MEKSSVNITNKVEITEVEQSLEKKIYEPRQGFYYRGIGEDGLKDAIESGFFRSPCTVPLSLHTNLVNLIVSFGGQNCKLVG